MDGELKDRLEARLASPSITPMMRQYLGVKAEYPHGIVLFRMGDFYETFFEDAEECAARLDITLTARSKERDVPMAGVPHHAIDGYLARLVEQGCTVVIVDQVEDPRQAKGLVRREITRVVTPGTYLDPNADARSANYLVSVELGTGRAKKRWGLAAIDVATGDFRGTAGEDEDSLVDELFRLDAKEVLLRESQSEDPRIARLHAEGPRVLLTRLDDRDYGEQEVLRRLDELLGAEELSAARTHLDPLALMAGGRALAYVARTQILPDARDLNGPAGLGHVRELRPYISGEALVLDREARAHLELFRTSTGERKGSLLATLDEAITAPGGRLLADWLAAPSRDHAVIEARHAAIESLLDAPGELDAIREGLKGLGDAERLVGRVVLGRALPRDLVALRRVLLAAPEVLQAAERAATPTLAPEASPTSRLHRLAETDVCADVAQRLAEALLDEPAPDPAAGPVFRPGYDPEIDRDTELAQHGQRMVSELEQREREATGIGSLRIRNNKVFGYFIEVTKANLSLVPDRFIRKQTMVNAERYFTDELKTLEDDVMNAEERRVANSRARYAELMADLGAEAGRLKRLAGTLAELDVLAAFAHLAEARDWTRPVMHGGDEIDIADGRHPVIESLAGDLGERFVPNDVRLSHRERLMLVTGPNMAGKSTIMRQTALIVILAHAGSYVPARKARVGRVDRVFTRVGASDDLSRGRSTFMVEMTETARILRAATRHDLVVLDEIGRGTSTYDGLSIAWSVAEHLHDEVQARTMFATHYHELTRLADELPGAVNRHVAVREHRDDIIFLRKLEVGATNRSYGVQVGRLAGLPAGVVARAKGLLATLETGEGGVVPVKDGTDGQLSLFGGASNAPAVDPSAQAVVDRLLAVDADDLSPRRALDLVAELQAIARR